MSNSTYAEDLTADFDDLSDEENEEESIPSEGCGETIGADCEFDI